MMNPAKGQEGEEELGEEGSQLMTKKEGRAETRTQVPGNND